MSGRRFGLAVPRIVGPRPSTHGHAESARRPTRGSQPKSRRVPRAEDEVVEPVRAGDEACARARWRAGSTQSPDGPRAPARPARRARSPPSTQNDLLRRAVRVGRRRQLPRRDAHAVHADVLRAGGRAETLPGGVHLALRAAVAARRRPSGRRPSPKSRRGRVTFPTGRTGCDTRDDEPVAARFRRRGPACGVAADARRAAAGAARGAASSRFRASAPTVAEAARAARPEHVGDLLGTVRAATSGRRRARIADLLRRGRGGRSRATSCAPRAAAPRPPARSITARIADESGEIDGDWFNQPWLDERLDARHARPPARHARTAAASPFARTTSSEEASRRPTSRRSTRRARTSPPAAMLRELVETALPRARTSPGSAARAPCAAARACRCAPTRCVALHRPRALDEAEAGPPAARLRRAARAPARRSRAARREREASVAAALAAARAS